MAVTYPIKRDLTAEAVREMFSYDPETGLLHWKLPRRRRTPAGTTKSRGHIYVCIDGRYWAAHRLAWLHYYGRHAGDILDHINRVRTDNRIANLREVTPIENALNTDRHHRPDVGVYANGSRWRAQISVNSRCLFLGSFKTREAAIAAVQSARSQS